MSWEAALILNLAIKGATMQSMHKRNVSSLALDFNDPIAILNIEVDDKVYRVKYVNY